MKSSSHPIVAGIGFIYRLLVTIGNHLQSPLLLLIRLTWGLQLMQAGIGKLEHIDKPIAFFGQIGIPFPVENAWLVAFTETFGGLFLALGFLTRLTSIPVLINFIVAYITTEEGALRKLAQLDPDDFLAAAPFLFLFAAVVALAFGPGAYSVDRLIAKFRGLPWRGPDV